MKEDILEQLVEDWLVSEEGWFVKHNVKYRPKKGCNGYDSRKDSVHSDIDIVAYSPVREGYKRVNVITCKSWQAGFNIETWLKELESEADYNKPSEKFQKREGWKSFRELVSNKWIEAFLHKIKNETNQLSFTYYIAVTKLTGKNIEENRRLLEQSEIIKDRFKSYGASVEIKLLPLSEIITKIQNRMDKKETPALESTDIGRLLQLLNAMDKDFLNISSN